jgi:hypothetical protein
VPILNLEAHCGSTDPERLDCTPHLAPKESARPTPTIPIRYCWIVPRVNQSYLSLGDTCVRNAESRNCGGEPNSTFIRGEKLSVTETSRELQPSHGRQHNVQRDLIDFLQMLTVGSALLLFLYLSSCYPQNTTRQRQVTFAAENSSLADSNVTSSSTTSMSQAASGADQDGSSTNILVPLSMNTRGSNPGIDATLYGVRAVSTVPQTMGSCSAGQATVAVRSSNDFRNGDGVVVYGCGAKNTLTTPDAPIVTPSEAAFATGTAHVISGFVGHTTYNYKIVARDKNGGLTASSLMGSTKMSAASLGAYQTTASTLTRSGNTVSVETSSVNHAVRGAVVFITGSTDATFSGFFLVDNVVDAAHFTYKQGMDTRGGASSSAVGGTVQIYLCNHLSWTAIPGAWQYYIYGRNGNQLTLIGATRPGETTFDDFGSPMMDGITLPDFVPTSAPTSATNDYLATTISAGVGTTALSLADAASSSASGTTIKFDDGPTILAAYNSATKGLTPTTLHFPVAASGDSYYINSHTKLGGSVGLTIFQEQPIILNETLELPGNLHWTGMLGGHPGNAPQFAWSAGQSVVVHSAYPGLTAVNPSIFRFLAFSGTAQGLIMTLSGGYEFNSTFEYSSFDILGLDYMGLTLVGYDSSNQVFRYVTFITNDSPTYGYSLTPAVLYLNGVAGGDPSGNILCDHCFFVGRGFGIDSSPPMGAGARIRFEETYAQALRTPLIMVGSLNNPTVHVNGFTNDTSSTATIANFGANGLKATILNVEDNGVEVGGRPGIVTGNPIFGLTVENGGDFIGQNRDLFRSRPNASLSIPVYSATSSANTPTASADYFMAAPLHFPSEHTLFWDLPAPAGVTAAVGPGGSVPIGGETYEVTSIGVDNGASAPSLPSTVCATTSGNQTCTITWSPVKGAIAYTVFRGYYGVVGCIRIKVANCTDKSSSAGGGVAPAVGVGSGTGLTTIMNNQVITPQLVLSNSSAPVAFTGALSQSNTANRTYTLPDVSGTIAIQNQSLRGSTYSTSSNCSSSASPAVCGSAAAGSVVIAVGATTVTVNTTVVSGDSQIFVQADATLGAKLGVVCNSTLSMLTGGLSVTARTAAANFQISTNGTFPAKKPLCISYHIVN